MDLRDKVSLIEGNLEETVTRDELVQLLDSNKNPKAYCGFEPSG